MNVKYLLTALSCGLSVIAFSQAAPSYDGGFKVKFNKDGTKYLRTVMWIQGQVNTNFNAPAGAQKTTMNVRRARLALFGQISPKFMTILHLGINNLNGNTLSPLGHGPVSQIFMHDAWAQYTFSKHLTVGTGLHLWNGISRLNRQSTLNTIPIDGNRTSWATTGLSDQFARFLGIFAKGWIGKLQYQISVNDAILNSLDTREPNKGGGAVYSGKKLLGAAKAGRNYSTYVEYNFLDEEPDFLPFKQGTWLGYKKVFNLGAGGFLHPNGVVYKDMKDQLHGQNVFLFAVDAFLDLPLSDKKDAITAYAVYQYNDYGKNYFFGPYGSGNMTYGHIGYVFREGLTPKIRFQPYIFYVLSTFDATQDNKQHLGIGLNGYLAGDNCKLTLEYGLEKFGKTTHTLNMQFMIYL